MDFSVKNTKRRGKNKSKGKQKARLAIVIIGLLIAIGCFVYMALFNKKVEDIIPIKKKKLTIVNEDSNKRPIAVMYDNNVGNNAHAGLQESYITYEIIVEGGLTRIMAVFKDKDVDLIGPVRSSRHYFLDYALEGDSIYTHFGWSPEAQRSIKSLGVNNINGLNDSAPFWRDRSIAAPHNVFTTTDKIYKTAEDKGYSTETKNWRVLPLTTDKINLNKIKVKDEATGDKVKDPDLTTASEVVIPYSPRQTRSYEYDSDTKRYLRFMNGNAHTDKESGKQLSYKNILIIKVANSNLDDHGRQDLDTVGTGEGYYITNGYALPIEWTKASRKSKTKYRYKNGKKLKINDGNTFIQITPIDSTLTIK